MVDNNITIGKRMSVLVGLLAVAHCLLVSIVALVVFGINCVYHAYDWLSDAFHVISSSNRVSIYLFGPRFRT